RVPEFKKKSPMKIARGRKAEVGDHIIALGSPLSLHNTVMTGIISGVDREFTIKQYTYDHAYQISAPITFGNSGGPLLDENTGEVLAINAAAAENGNIGFSIPMPDVMDQVT